jgi:hypothetical protein
MSVTSRCTASCEREKQGCSTHLYCTGRMLSSGMLHCVAFFAACFRCTLLLTLFLAHRFLSFCWWWQYVPLKRRFLQDPHGVTSKNTAFFIVITVKTSNLTYFIVQGTPNLWVMFVLMGNTSLCPSYPSDQLWGPTNLRGYSRESMKLTTHPEPRSTMMEPYLHSFIYLHGMPQPCLSILKP